MNMSTWKKVLRYSTLLFASSVLLAACAGEDVPDPEDAVAEGSETASDDVPDADADDGDTLMVGLTNAPDSFNPFYRPGVAGTWVQRFFYDSLLVMPTADSFEPALG